MPVNLELWDAADILYFEVESPDGFVARFATGEFSEEHWEQLWSAVAMLLNRNQGQLDSWASHDLTRTIEVVQLAGHKLVGRRVDSLNDFERAVLKANEFLNGIIEAAGP